MTTTQNETAVILALATNDFGNQAGDWVWANSINDARKPSGIEGKALSGVVSSLVQKGLVETDGNTGRDACVRLTETGLELAASEMEPKVTKIVALIDLTNLTVQFTNDGEYPAETDLYVAGSAPELEDLSGPQSVAIYNTLVAELNASPAREGQDPIPTTKRFADKGTATKRVWGLIEMYAALHVPADQVTAPVKEVLKPEEKAEIAAAKNIPAPKAATTPRRGTGINLAPLKVAYACREGSKQATLVDMLFRPEGATMDELLVATSGGKTPWKEVSVKSGLNWDMNKIKGYGIKTDKRGDDDCYHLVLPAGLTAPIPHTAKKGA